jgi:alpha-tubulin suppressor-like RCC1 family protein
MYHAAARTVDGSVLTWGRQFECSLGRKNIMDDQIGEPGIVEALPRTAVVKVLCGYLHTAAVTRAGQVFTWGSGESGALGHGGFSRARRDKTKPAILNP